MPNYSNPMAHTYIHTANISLGVLRIPITENAMMPCYGYAVGRRDSGCSQVRGTAVGVRGGRYYRGRRWRDACAWRRHRVHVVFVILCVCVRVWACYRVYVGMYVYIYAWTWGRYRVHVIYVVLCVYMCVSILQSLGRPLWCMCVCMFVLCVHVCISMRMLQCPCFLRWCMCIHTQTYMQVNTAVVHMSTNASLYHMHTCTSKMVHNRASHALQANIHT